MRARDEPNDGDHRDDGIVERLRHRAPAETVALRRPVVAEDRELHGRRFEPFKLQPRVERRAVAIEIVERLGVQCAKLRRTAVLASSLATTTQRQGWLLPTDGACWAQSSR